MKTIKTHSNFLNQERLLFLSVEIIFLGVLLSNFFTGSSLKFWSDSKLLLNSLFLISVVIGILLFTIPSWWKRSIKIVFLLFGTVGLLGMFIPGFLSSGEKFPMFLEQGIKMGIPLWLLLSNVIPLDNKWILKILIAATFIGHGLFAMGVYPVPGQFIAMTVSILHISEGEAEVFLFVIGILDLLSAVLLLIWENKIVWYYLIIWGFITALARVVYGISVAPSSNQFLYWLMETIYRIPHGLIPLIAWKSNRS